MSDFVLTVIYDKTKGTSTLEDKENKDYSYLFYVNILITRV